MTLRTVTIASAAVLVLGGSLAACGKLGELEKPSAVSPARPAPAQPGAAKTTGDLKDPSHSAPPNSTSYLERDKAIDPLPPRTIPIPSSGYNPEASQVQGALPDPYATPR